MKTVDKFLKNQKKKEKITKEIKQKRKRNREERLRLVMSKEWLTVRAALGNQWANWYCFIGGRQAGKTYSVQKYVLKCFFDEKHPLYHVPFTWMRLNDVACNNMTQNNCAHMFEPDLMRMFGLYDLKYSGSKLTCKSKFDGTGKDLYLCDIYGLSTAYNKKGAAIFDNKNFKGKNIVMDEIAYEKNQKKTFDVAYGVSLQIENLTRNKRHRVKVMMMLNQTEDCPDVIATIFGYIPLEFGTYSLVRHKKDILRLDRLMDSKDPATVRKAEKEYENLAIKEKGNYFGIRGLIYNMPVTDMASKRNAVRLSKQADPNGENFTNKIERDLTLLNHKRLYKPSYIIKFTKYIEDWFVVWLNGSNEEVIAKYKNEKCKNIRAMRPNCGDSQEYSPLSKQYVIDMYNARAFMFQDYKTMKIFENKILDIPGMKSR